MLIRRFSTMNADEMIIYFKKISDNNLSETEKELEAFSEKDLYSFANKLLKNPYEINEILLVTLRNLYSEKKEFVDLFCRFLEDAYSFYLGRSKIEIIENRVTERADITFNIVKSMVNMGDIKGISAGSLLFLIYDKMEEADNFFIQGLKSENENFQRCSLVSLFRIMNNGSSKIDKYLDILKNVASNISPENEYHLILCLQHACNIDPKGFQDILNIEIEKRGANAALNYIQANEGYPNNSPTILRNVIQILEYEDYDEEDIDWGLAQIYKIDSDFVVKRIEYRLHEQSRFKLMGYHLEEEIKKIGNGPIIELIESEIDEGTQICEYVLEDLFPSRKEWICWCEKWNEDPNKEYVILKSLGVILSELVNYKHDDLRDQAINIVKKFAKNKNLDYETETKGINLGADKTEGYKNKESAIEALDVLNKILNPTIKIEINELENNLVNAPNLCNAFGYSWLIKNAKTSNPHIINCIFCQNLPIYQSYLENAFSILKENNIKIRKQKLHDIDNDKNILAEIEVISKLIPCFKVTPEPDIEKLKPKKLDLMIEYNGEKALIEIATVKEKQVIRLSHGAQTCIPGDKIKNELLDKFKDQLYEGKIDVEIPIIILLNLQGFHTDDEVKNGIYGIGQFSWKRRSDTNQVVEEGFTREKNGFYDEENSEIVTAIGAYKVDLYREDKFVGKLYKPIKYPINKMSQNFRLRLRDALFGNSETSNWKTLVKIPGIDENLAELLYSSGIDDIDTLATVDENSISIKDLSREKICEFKSESIRIIYALSTHSIRYLRGIDAEDIKIFSKEGLYLIPQLFEREKIPEGINQWKWDLLVEDAKRIIQ